MAKKDKSFGWQRCLAAVALLLLAPQLTEAALAHQRVGSSDEMKEVVADESDSNADAHLSLSYCAPSAFADGIRTAMESEVSRLFRLAGISIDMIPWTALARGQAPRGRLIKVILLDRDGTGWDLPAKAMGAVMKEPNRRTHGVAYIFLPVVFRVLDGKKGSLEDLTDRAVGKALGRVVAHELVHAVAPEHSHRRDGTMAAAAHREQLLKRTARLNRATMDAVQRVVLKAGGGSGGE